MKNSKSFFLNKYLVLLLAIFSRMIINIGGEISPSLVFIGLTLPIWYQYIRFDKNVSYFTKMFVLIIAVQLCWMPFAYTDIMTQIKGVSITISGLLFFLFYYFIFINKPNLLKWHLLGLFISSFLFINVLAEMAGGEFGMWKFQIYPRIILFVVLVCIWNSSKIISHLTPFIFISIGMLGLATGARSSGLTPFIAGVIIFFVKYKKNISLSKLKANFIIMAFIIYFSYAFIYVPNVLNGNISSGNSEQLKQVENPYNPLNLLMMGRTDSVIPFLAFLEKPITGWGYYTPDPDLKYHYLMSKLTDDVKTVNDGLLLSIKDIPIPGHSVIGYYACSYGIVVLLLFCAILYRFSKIFMYSLFSKDYFLPYRAYIYINIIWNLFFSPPAHLKTLPCSIGILVALSLISIFKRKESVNDRNIK